MNKAESFSKTLSLWIVPHAQTLTHVRLTWARSGFAFALGREAGPAEQAAGVEEAAAVLVWIRQRVGRVGRDGVVRGLAVHRGQAAAQRTTALHFHAVRQRHLVGLDRILLVHPGRSGGRGGGAGVRRHVFRRGRGETVEVRAGVGPRGERRHGGRAGVAAAGVAGAGGVQAGFAEVTDRPCVVVVRSGQGSFAGVQPGNPGAVDEVWSADLVPSETSWNSK